MEIKDKRGAENLAADHLLRLEHPKSELQNELEINETFSEEDLYVIDEGGKL